MSQKQNDEFYVGYMPEAPDGHAKLIRKSVLGLFGLAIVLAAALLVSQKAFYPSVFEFGVNTSFEGIIQEKPYPVLLVERPGDVGKLPGYSQYYLVSFGKYGAQEVVKGLNGKRVRLEGSLIYRDNQTMIEVLEGTVETVGDASSDIASFSAGVLSGKSLGTFELAGEIVDSKCFLGVMNPGELKPHKACATRCISGGAPPIFIARDGDGVTNYFLLVSQDGRMVNDQILPLVADPIQIKGEVIQQDNLMLLKADPATYQRINP